MRLAVLAAALLAPALALDSSCYALLGAESAASPKDAPVQCPTGTDPNACLTMCGLCTTPDLRFGLGPAGGKYCSGGPVPSADIVAGLAYGAIANMSAAHGTSSQPCGSPSGPVECVT